MKIIIENNDETKVFDNISEYWVFVKTDEKENSHFQHDFNCSKLFRGYVQNHVILNNLAEHINNLKNPNREAEGEN